MAQRSWTFVSGLSINLELYEEVEARRYAPNKKALGRSCNGQFIKQAVKIFGPNRVRSLLMVGLEPPEATLAGVEFRRTRLLACAEPVPPGAWHAFGDSGASTRDAPRGYLHESQRHHSQTWSELHQIASHVSTIP